MLQSRRSWLAVMFVRASTIACGDDAPTPTAPTNPAGTVTGLLRGEAPAVSRIARPHPVLANATVTVIGGPASGSKTTTREDGTYSLAAAGTFKLRFEHPSFLTAESSESTVVTANAPLTMPETILLTAPWTISGRITDSLGHPVPDAEVIVAYGAFLEHGRVRTDGAGRYVLNSTQPRFESVLVVAQKPGFHPMQHEAVAKCCGDVQDIRIVRIVSITPTTPSSLRVGESLEMPASVVVFDTGETRNIFVLPASSAPSVVAVNRSSHWYEMRGVNAGVATLTFDLWGAIATVQVQVR
jgi:hypothetical protein